MTEREISKQSVAWLRAQGAICIKLTGNYRYGTVGWPDYLVVRPGWKGVGGRDEMALIWFLEFKRPGKSPTSLQRRRFAQLEELGARVVVSSSLEETKAAWNAA